MLTIETPDKTKISISRDGFHNLLWDETEKVYKIATNNFYMQCITVNKINDINIENLSETEVRKLIAKYIDDDGIKTTYLEGEELEEFLKKYPPKKFEGYASIEEMYEDIRRLGNRNENDRR